MRIYDICRGNGVNNAYFICKAKDFPSVNDGIWNISMDGVKKTQIVNQFEFGGAPYELDFDRVGNKVYWGEGPNADRMTIWRHNADGSGKNQQVIINGVPEVGSFAVDGEGKRIFFKYKKDFKVVIGTCDLNGNIITPIVTTMPELLDIFSPIDLDINNQKLYTATKGQTVILYANMNGIKQASQVLYESSFNYVNWTYDFPKSNLYFTKLGNLNTIFSSGFQDQNEKVLLSGFEGITSIASIFTY
jgi:hypothetical protein